MTHVRRLLAFALGVLLAQGAGAATKYVSPDGSALWAACTTADTPCALSTAQTSAAAGDVVIMLSGSYGGLNTSTNGTSTDYITWLADNYGLAILDGLASGQTDKTLVIDNNYHRFVGVRVNVQTGPGTANVYGVYATGTAWQFLDGEVTYTGDEATTGTGSIIYCVQLRSAGLYSGGLVHNCTYGINLFSSSAGFAATITGVRIRDMLVGDHEDSDGIAVSGAASYDWTGTVFSDLDVSGWRDDGADFSNQDNVVLQDSVFHEPARDTEDDNSSCIKVGYEGSNGNRVRRFYCYGLHSTEQDNYGLILTGASDAIIESGIVSGAYEGATIAERNGAGGDDNTLRHLVLMATRDDGIQIGTGSTGTFLQNSILSGATRDINVLTGITATGANNRRVNGTGNGDGTYNQTGDTDGDPQFSGGTHPTTANGFRLLPTSPLIRAGTPVAAGSNDYEGYNFEPLPTIGAFRGPTPRLDAANDPVIEISNAAKVGPTPRTYKTATTTVR